VYIDSLKTTIKLQSKYRPSEPLYYEFRKTEESKNDFEFYSFCVNINASAVEKVGKR
jgi:hypothetical protein